MTTETKIQAEAPQPKPKPKAQYDNEAGRAGTVTLKWPFTLDGRRYERIHLKRLTAGEVSAFQETVAKAANDSEITFPIYRDDDGDLISQDVLNALDDDDNMEIVRVTRNFLPRRYQGVLASDSDPKPGVNTAS